ncbi:MAG: selenium cofactor biosynthesis protein YqeC [Gammaproteobacteria bacterium]
MHKQPDAPAPTTLHAALGAERGVVCLVGAGGKKSTMYALAAGCAGRVALSSTSHMYRYAGSSVDQVIEVGDYLPRAAATARVVAYCGPTDTPQRVGGLSEEQLAELAARREFDLMLIKADGARARLIKAPAAHEPLIPAWADTVIALVSARVLGRRLSDGIAHRPEQVAAVVDADLATPLTAVHLARLLSSVHGALKGVGAATVVPLINMVDDAALHEQAHTAARLALASTTRFERVVLGVMKEGRVVEVVRR